MHADAVEIPENENIHTELYRLTESLNLLSAMKASKRPADAIALQTALNAVIQISEEEVRTTSIKLATQKNISEAEDEIRADIIKNLASLKIYMQTVRINTTQEAGPTAIAWIAQKFKEWREGLYTQTIEQATAFIGVFENETSIQSASARLNAILKDEKKIRALLPTSKTNVFMRLVKNTQANLRKATELNTEAHALLTPTTDTTYDTTTIHNRIAESNALIDSIYDDFVTMSKLIKK